MVETTQEGIWTIDANGVTTYVNPAMARILQYKPVEMIGRHLFDFTDDRGQEICACNMKRREQGIVEQHDFEFIRKDGSRIIATLETAPLQDEKGNYMGAIAGVIDVTERRLAEANLERLSRRLELKLAEQSRELDNSQRQFEAIFQGAGDLIFFSDIHGNVMVANSAVETILGYSPEEFTQLHVLDIVVGLNPAEMTEILQQLSQSGQVSREDLHRHRDGSLVPVEVKLTSVVLDGKSGIVVIARDLREKKKMEQSLFVSQKREAIGRLAGGIAHEYNNRLATILLAGRMALHHLASDHPAREYLERIMTSAQNSAILTKQLLAFGCQQILHPKILDINSIVKQTERLLSPLLPEDIDLSLDMPSQLPTISFDPALFEQIIINLVINARDALTTGGGVIIRTGQSRLQAKDLGAFPAKTGHFVWVEVEDNGEGMDPETAERAFEPFFTTKDVGQGTGLGLSMVQGTVQQANGYVELESYEHQGTRVRVYFPARDDAVTELPVMPQSPQSRVLGQGHVLLVEDEEDLRSLCQTILEHAGYQVTVAHSYKQAEEVCLHDPRRIDLLLTDVVMPGRSGPELYRHVSPMRESMKVLFISGYDKDILSREGLNLDDCFLSKPFNSDQLIQAVDRLIGKVNRAPENKPDYVPQSLT